MTGINDCDVYNCTIEGIGANSSYIGGIAGTTGGFSNYCSVQDCIIKGNGSNVGGIHGYRCGAKQSFVSNTEITGYSNVGGVNGQLTTYNGEINNCYVNARIYATSNNIGGLVGYANNTNANGVNTVQASQNAVFNCTIEGANNVGGILGKLEEELQDITWYQKNYIEAKIYGDESSTSLGIGSNERYNSLIEYLYYYKYSTINNEFPNEHNEIFISQDSYLVEQDLKVQTTYTSKLKWSTSYWKFDLLKDNKYPILKHSHLPTQTGIDIPKDSEHIVGNAESNIQTQNIIEQEEPEQTFEYNNKQIQTFSTYSIITASDGSSATRNAKLYVKDNNLYAIPSILTITADNENITPVEDNLIIDSYNGKEYETVLGSDGKLYDLKEPITYPEDFVNENIESIGNNLNNDSHEVEVTYKNGDKVRFNYQTGEVISAIETETGEQTGLFDYLKEKISTIGDTTSGISQELTKQYEESQKLQTKLEETSVEEAIEEKNSNSNITNDNVTEETKTTETNNSLKENKYISMYNEETGQYEIYNEEELLDTSKEEVVSENEKIEANNLSEYYASEGETKNTKQGIVWIVISIIGVGIILFILKKNLKKKA